MENMDLELDLVVFEDDGATAYIVSEGGPDRAPVDSVTRDGVVTRFGIGYAPDTWDSLKKLLAGKGYSEKELVDAGLLVHNAERGSVYDAFRGRLIFPILGVDGKVLGFGARVMGDENWESLKKKLHLEGKL